jgi:hypothetical protein
LLALLAEGLIVAHSWSSQLVKQEKAGLSPSLIKCKGSVLHGFPRCQYELVANEEDESTSSIK